MNKETSDIILNRHIGFFQKKVNPNSFKSFFNLVRNIPISLESWLKYRFHCYSIQIKCRPIPITNGRISVSHANKKNIYTN